MENLHNKIILDKIKTDISNILNSYLFEFNNEQTRNNIKDNISNCLSYLNLKSKVVSKEEFENTDKSIYSFLEVSISSESNDTIYFLIGENEKEELENILKDLLGC